MAVLVTRDRDSVQISSSIENKRRGVIESMFKPQKGPSRAGPRSQRCQEAMSPPHLCSSQGLGTVLSCHSGFSGLDGEQKGEFSLPAWITGYSPDQSLWSEGSQGLIAEVTRLKLFLEGQWGADTANGEICDLNHPFQFCLLGASAPLL